jgi:hypothetical protein
MSPEDFAFPIPEMNWSNGMTLRDYFAAKFMQGFIAAPDRDTEYSHVTKDECAKRAYEMADAMLQARSATKE